MMSAQVFRTCPFSEMPWERWSGLPYEVQKNKFHRLQAHHNRLPLSRSHWHVPHPPPHAKQIPNPRGVQTKDQAQFSFTPQSTKYLTTNSPNVEKEISCFPCLSFLSPTSPTSYGQFQQKEQCFFLLFDRHLLNSYYVPGSVGNSGNGYEIILIELLMYTQQALL